MINVNIYYHRECSINSWDYWMVDVDNGKCIRDGKILSCYKSSWLVKTLIMLFEFYYGKFGFQYTLISVINENYKGK